MTTQSLTPQTKVSVEYADNKGNRETTIAELEAQFSDETADWRKWFFTSLEQQGYANGTWATYTVIRA